jgi:hypothetical protein
MTNGLPTRLPINPRIRRYGSQMGMSPGAMGGRLSPLSYAQMLSAADAASKKAFPQQAQGTSRVPMPTVLPMPKPTPPPSQPSGFMSAFSQPLMSPVGQAISQAAIEGARASDYSRTPVSLGRVLAEMGAAASKGYAGAQDRQLANLLTQAKIAEKMGTAGQAFRGQSMEAQSFNALLKIGPKIKDGTATEAEKGMYNLAYGRLAKPQPIPTYDELGNQTITVVPAQDLSMFPEPPSGVGRIGTSTTKPSPEAIKSDKFVKSMGSMALNVNRYRQALGKLDRLTDMPSGAVGMPTADMAAATAIAEALRLNLKELYELGALVGGDFQILDNMLTSPNTAKAIKAGPQALMIQLDELERVLQQKLAEKDVELTGTFTMPIDASSEDTWKKVKPGQYAKLPDGRVVMKGASQ